MILPWWMNEAWDWFWYYRRGKVKFNVWDYGDTYNASAHTRKISVWNCYGGTPDAAKEMALYRLNRAINREPKEKELIHEWDGFALYREK